MRFLHTSDWHLGRIFHGVHLTEDQAYLLEQFIDLVRETKPDAVVIAGDVYDRAVPPTEAVELLDTTLSRILLDYQVSVIVIAGNHDSPERLGFGNKLLARQGLHVVGPLTGLTPIALEDEYGSVYFAPFTYAEPALVREHLQEPDASDHQKALEVLVRHVLKPIPTKARKVAIAHAFIAGGLTTESERPLSVGGSSMVTADLFSNFNYTALGHLHNAQKVGGEHIRYSGSLLKYSFAEANQTKAINLVELDQNGNVQVEMIYLTPKRDVRIVEGYLKDIVHNNHSLGVSPGKCSGLSGKNPADYIQVVLKDTDPILDAMGQLRAVFPNVLAIERPYLLTGGNLQGSSIDHRKLAEKELFASFFEQTTGDALTGAQEQELERILEEVYREIREVAR